MKNINNVTVAGFTCADPEYRETANGTKVCNFRLAFNNRTKVDGKWEDVSNFIDVTVFGGTGEWLSEHMPKGTKIAVQGYLHMRQWEKDGQKRSKIEIVGTDVEMMARGEAKAVKAEIIEPGIYDEEIPF